MKGRSSHGQPRPQPKTPRVTPVATSHRASASNTARLQLRVVPAAPAAIRRNTDNSGGASGMNYAVPGSCPGRFQILLRTQHRQHGGGCRVSGTSVHIMGIPESFPIEPSGRLLYGQWRRLGQYGAWTRIRQQHATCRRGDGVLPGPKRRRTLDGRLAVRSCGRCGTSERRWIGADF